MEVGEKNGKLTLVKHLKKVSNNNYALFQCDCGNRKPIRMYLVQKGIQSSCGCVFNKIRKKKRIQVGEKNGKLTLVSYSEMKKYKKSVHAMANFACDCGNIINARISTVKRGESRSCGKCRGKKTK